jgi:predicted membrane protein
MSSDEPTPESPPEPQPEPEELPKEPNAVLETAPPVTPEPPPPRARPRLPLTRLMLGGLLLAGGVLWLLGALDVIDVSVTAALSVALIVVGLALLGGSFTGRRHSGLIAIGIVLTVTLALASTFDIKLNGGVGDRNYQPTSLAELKGEYHLGVGQLTIDLTGLTFAEAPTTHVKVTVGIGQLTVHVPGGLGVTVHGTAGLGEVVLFDHQSSGFEVDLTQSRPPIATQALGTLVLELSVGLGQVTVDGA